MKTFDGYKKRALTDEYALLAGGGHKPLSDFSTSAHTHSIKINGATKTIAASGGTAVDLGNYKTILTAVTSPTASGTSISFIDTISLNTNGVIAVTKKTVPTMRGATASAAGTVGLVPAPAANLHTLFLKGDGTWATPSDTHWTTHLYIGAKNAASNATTTNGNTYIKVTDNSTIRNQYIIKGAGRTTIASDSSGNITITSPTVTWSEISGKPSTFAPSSHNHPTSQINALTSYVKATVAAALATTDSLNTALGKLEYKLDVAYDLVTKANDSDGTIENLKEILDVLAGIKDTETIKAIIGKYLPLAGGAMTGSITRYYSAESSNPMIALTSNKLDVWLWRINGGTSNSTATSGTYGFGLKYIGRGYGDENYLVLYADNQKGPQVAAMTVSQSGAFTFANTVRATTFIGALSGNATTATSLTTNAGSATLPIYFSGGKPVACTASSVFSNLSNSGNNISVTVAGLNRMLTVGYATSATELRYYKDSDTSADNLVGTEHLKWSKRIVDGSTNLFSHEAGNNANSIIYIPTSSTAWGTQLGFNALGEIFSRAYRQSLLGTWNKIAFTSDIPTALKNPYTLTFTAGTFAAKTYDGSSAVTVNIPTHTSHLVNNSGFLTSHQSLANYVTLNTALTISGVKTFSTLLKFTVAQGTSPFTVTSTTKVNNLNADLLDGYHASNFEGRYEFTADLSNYSNTKYYPVYFNWTKWRRVHLSFTGNGMPSNFSERSDKSSYIWFEEEISVSGWSGSGGLARIIYSHEEWGGNGKAILAKVSQNTNSSLECFWLRGGCKYTIYCNVNIGNPTIVESSFTSNSITFSTIDTLLDFKSLNSDINNCTGQNVGIKALYATNAGNAARWKTARTLTIGNTGKSVDGSANVSWSLAEIGAASSGHTHTFASLTSKPATLLGYGITNGMWFSNDNAYYLAARFNNADFAKKAADTYIEFWSGTGWYNFKAGKYIVPGGTSSHFLKGDGSLDSNIYATTSHTHDDKYLKLTGGILRNNSMHSVATLNATNGSNDAWNKDGNAMLKFVSNNNAMIFSIGSPGNERTGFIQVGHADTNNYASVTSALHLNKLGGTVYINNNIAWHAGNDGSGSGLDADLLDGKHASDFATAGHNHDSRYLRKDTNDSTPYQYEFTKTNDHAIKVGTIRGRAVGSQTGEYIHLYERVAIGSPSGWGSRPAPSYGLATYGGAWLATDTGNVGIGTTSPSEKLTVAGWVGTTGSTGWYNITYAGGIYMSDSTWVRTYNNKKFYVSNSDYNAIHSAGGVYVAGMVHSYANYLKSTNNGRYVQIGPKNSSHVHYETDADVSHWFNKRVDVNGAIWRYNTNYGIDSSGYFHAKGIYANRDGSSTGGGVSLYSTSDPMTYGIAFRGTGTYGTYGGVTGDWATYLTMSNTTNRGWIFRRGSTNVASVDGTGTLSLAKNIFLGGGSIKQESRNYPLLKGCDRSKWYKLTLPWAGTATFSSTRWFMLSFEIHFGGSYSSGLNGCAYVQYYFTGGTGGYVKQDVRATAIGNRINQIGLYYSASDPGILYIYANPNTYNSIYISHFTAHDSAPSYDFLNNCSLVAIADQTPSNFTAVDIAYLNYDGSLFTINKTLSGTVTNAINASSASTVIVNSSDANSTYRMVWHSGNTLYGTNNIYCNPYSDQIYSAGFRHVSYNSASYLLRSDGGAAAFNWSGQGGQPAWLWGGNSQHTYYVYNPSNFNVNYANTSGAISNLTASDAASSTATWRKVWISYENGTTGRPALSDSLAFQTSTGTLKATIFQGNLSGTSTYSYYLRGRSTDGSYFDTSAGNLIIAEWNTKSDSRWYLKAASSYECRVAYASSAGNAESVDGQHFNWNNNKNDHTYLWAASSNGQAYLVHRASMSVNYANYSGYSQKLLVQDVRSATRTPNYFDGKRVTAWFNNTGTPDGDWWSGIHVKGWDSGYASWELCSYSSTGTGNDYNLYFRNGNNTSWGSWKTILTSSNYSSYCASTSHTHSVKINGTIKTISAPGGHVVDLGTYLTSHQSVTNKAATLAWGTSSTIATIGSTNITLTMPANPNTDTKNTAGSTNTSSKIFLIGATSQAANPLTYSHDTAYVGTDGCLYSGSAKVLTAHQTIYSLTIQGNGTTIGTYTPNSAAKTVNITPANIGAAASSHTHSYLPLAGGTMTANARISHSGNLYIGRSDNGGWVLCLDMCSLSSTGDTYWSLRTSGTLKVKFVYLDIIYPKTSAVKILGLMAVGDNSFSAKTGYWLSSQSIYVGNENKTEFFDLSGDGIHVIHPLPHIDFYKGKSSVDGNYTLRLIENTEGRLTLDSATTTPSLLLAGNIYASGYYESSDITLKTNFSKISTTIEQISDLPVFDFSWKENLSSRNTGTSAQAVQTILPNIVTESSGSLKLNYGVLGTVAGIIACKELVIQKSEIEQLRERVIELEKQLNEYRGIRNSLGN